MFFGIFFILKLPVFYLNVSIWWSYLKSGGSSGSTHSSSSSESCRSGEPVPVPSQRATFHQMTSSGSSDQISATLQPESPRHHGIPTNRPSPPPRSQPINMRRVSDHRAPDVASLSPPAVSWLHFHLLCFRDIYLNFVSDTCYFYTLEQICLTFIVIVF